MTDRIRQIGMLAIVLLLVAGLVGTTAGMSLLQSLSRTLGTNVQLTCEAQGTCSGLPCSSGSGCRGGCHCGGNVCTVFEEKTLK